MDVQQSDPAPQLQALARVADRTTDHTIRFETGTVWALISWLPPRRMRGRQRRSPQR